MTRMTDSARWCDRCQAHGDHHTDRHPGGSTLLPDAPTLADIPTLARANCRVHQTHRPSIERQPGVYTVENHHIWPKEFGGPDEPENMVYVCPTGHTAIHELLRLYVKYRGTPPWLYRRVYSTGERHYAQQGFDRIVAAGRLPEVRQRLGLSDQD